MNAIATVPATKPNAIASHQTTAMIANSKAEASSVATVSLEKIIVAVPHVGPVRQQRATAARRGDLVLVEVVVRHA